MEIIRQSGSSLQIQSVFLNINQTIIQCYSYFFVVIYYYYIFETTINNSNLFLCFFLIKNVLIFVCVPT